MFARLTSLKRCLFVVVFFCSFLSTAFAQTVTFGNGDPGYMRALVQGEITRQGLPYSIGGIAGAVILRSDGGWDDGSNLHHVTLWKVCEILGYRTYLGSTCRDNERSGTYPHGKCNYHSPYNNQLNRFTSNNFYAESAEPKYGKTWIATITCGDPITQCNNGRDDDGDGATDFPNDFSCSNAQDNDETNPRAQCQDGIDNDGDGLTDFPNDPGCSSKQDNSERNPNGPQCDNGIDDDGDGQIDFPADSGCTGPTDPTEGGQCGDGVDNDGDGATDFPNDFSCSDRNDNDETNPRAQCQDGSDNDGDGLVDFPNDPGCSSRQDNSERNPNGPQCDNGADDDGDGQVDFPADPGCTGPTDPTESGQCGDGVDNDNDGATDFPADFSCSNRDDNDETNPRAQCQDGSDNDGDGATDFPADFGCSSKQDNDESNPRAQCQDGIDNDGDGATDFPSDFSCSSQQDNDETNPKAQCQDGVDNDGDGFVDFGSDPGCSSRQDNFEGDGTSQCQDGSDNDGDGATDFPNDFSCSNGQDNDETNPKAACQNGIDDDGDGLTDFPSDPGCSSKQDDSERNPNGPQCDNGRDDDADGRVDFPADPGCTGPTDPTEDSQCSDNVDNDNDGATDFPADFSCTSRDDDDESNPKSSCQDGLDNDGDGLVDLADPGCTDKQDNDETDAASVAPLTDCVFNNADGTYTAYFGYESTSGSDVSIPIGNGGGSSSNYFSPGILNRGQPTTFRPGRTRGAFSVVFDGNPISWNIQRPGTILRSAVASRNSQACAPITPLAECYDFTNNGGYSATFGYQNDNPFTVAINIGILNKFSPLPENRGQTTAFVTGRASAQFSVPFATGTQVEWQLNGRSALGSQALPLCPGSQGCTLSPTTTIKSELDKTALTLADTLVTAAKMLNATVKKQGLNSGRSPIDAVRASKKSAIFLEEARTLMFLIPDVIKSCPNAPSTCSQVDNQPTIDGLSSLYRRQWSAIRRTLARSEFRKSNSTKGVKTLTKSTRQVYKNGLTTLSTIPRFATDCS